MTGGRASGLNNNASGQDTRGAAHLKTRTTFMDKNEARLMLAGHALTGLLTNQDKDKGWHVGTLSVLSLKIADAVLHFSEQEDLPDLVDPRSAEPEPESNVIVQPKIITP